MTIGQAIRKRRDDLGWTQDDLSKKTGLKPTAISHFETDRRSPSCANLKKLCRALNVSADEILGLP